MTDTELSGRVGGGTLLTHRVRVEPHGWFGRLVAAMEIGFKGRRAVEAFEVGQTILSVYAKNEYFTVKQ